MALVHTRSLIQKNLGRICSQLMQTTAIELDDGKIKALYILRNPNKIEWSCHVLNKSEGTLKFTNNTYTGEMCILDGELVGANCTSSSSPRGF